MAEPLAQTLTSVARRYFSELQTRLKVLPIDRYHHVLMLIERHEGLTQKALSELLFVDKSYMANMIDYLESSGYVVRVKNPADRREQLVSLSQQARRDLPSIQKAIGDLDSILLKNIPESKRQIFAEVLYTIQANLLHIEETDSRVIRDTENI